MKIYCRISYESKELLEASVFVSTTKNKRKIMKYREHIGYEIDLNVKDREVITFEIYKEGFEPLICKNFARKEGYIFVLGKIGVKYMRYGDSIIPKNNYSDLIYISGYGAKFEKYINQLGIEKVTKYNGKFFSTEGVYKLKPQSTDNIGSIIKILRRSDLVQFAGYIANIEDTYTVSYSDHLKVYFRKEATISMIEKFVEQLNCELVQGGHKDNYSIISIKKGFVDDLSDYIERIYQTGLVDLIFPLTIATFPGDSLPNNFLWKGQYEHSVIEVKDAWTILGVANGVSQTFGTGDIIVGVTDDGLTPRNNGGGYTQNASFTGMVTKKDETLVPKILKLQDFRDDYFFATDPDFQLPFVSRGVQLGKFFCGWRK